MIISMSSKYTTRYYEGFNKLICPKILIYIVNLWTRLLLIFNMQQFHF